MGKVKRQGFRGRGAPERPPDVSRRTRSAPVAGVAVLIVDQDRTSFMHSRHRTGSTFIRFEHPALTDLVTIFPYAAGSRFERTGPISKGGVFQPVRVAVTRPPGIPPTRSEEICIRR